MGKKRSVQEEGERACKRTKTVAAPAAEPEEEESMDDEDISDSELQAMMARDDAEEYMASLPEAVAKRVAALKALHAQNAEIEIAMNREIAEAKERIVKKFATQREPIERRRAEIISGDAEPTAEETKNYVPAEKKEGEEKKDEKEEKEEKDIKGVPEFWFRALFNNAGLRALSEMSEADKPALLALRDIRVANTPRVTEKTEDGKTIIKHGFTLTFVFAENEFFTDRELTKTYVLTEDENGEPGFERSEGTKINWRPGKNLGVHAVKKAVPQKRGMPKSAQKQTKVVEEPCATFFNLFQSRTMPKGDAAEPINPETVEALSEELQRDYEIGCEIHDNIVPNAVLWFSGEAIEDDDDDECCGMEDCECDEEEDEDEDEEEVEAAKGKKKAKKTAIEKEQSGPAEKPECKQQ